MRKLWLVVVGVAFGTMLGSEGSPSSGLGVRIVASNEAEKVQGGACTINCGTGQNCCPGHMSPYYSNVQGSQGLKGDATYTFVCDPNFPDACSPGTAARGCTVDPT